MDLGRDEQEFKRLRREGIRRRTRKSHEINREIKRRRAREKAREKREALQSDKYIHSFPSNPNPKAFFWWEKKLIFSDYHWADLPSASKTVYPILGGLCGQYGTTSVSQLRLAAEAGRSPRVIGEGVKGLVDQWGDIFSAEPRSYSHRSSRSSGHKGYTYHLGTILNDIYILHKLTLFSNKEAKTEVETKATNSQSFFLLLILSGKLYEGWGVLKDLFFQNEQKLSKEYEKYLPDEAKNDLEKIKKYFGKGNNLIFKIRNEFSFHYDPKKIKDALNNFPDDEPLEIYLSTSRANCLYYASTVLLMDAVLGTTGRDISDRESAPALKQFFDKVSNVTSWMSNFFYHCFLVVPKKLGWNQCPIKETVEIEDAPSIDDISLPYFIKKPK